MFININNCKRNFPYRILCGITVFLFVFTLIIPPQRVQAQSVPVVLYDFLNLPAPGTMLSASPVYSPAMIKGVMIHPDNPLKFNFILDQGNTNLTEKELEDESQKLIKYFLASLTIPEKEMWVNLSPYEKDRIIPNSFGETEMGRDLLAQDYLLKQVTASLMYPEGELGVKFWKRIYKKANEVLGTTEILPTFSESGLRPSANESGSVGAVNTFNKVWIVPQSAKIYEHQKGAYVVESYLKVMLEEDYVSMDKNRGGLIDQSQNRKILNQNEGVINYAPTQNDFKTNIIRDILLPEIEREVNEGATFANLRQIYNSMILATWYKNKLKESIGKNSILMESYIDKGKVKGVDVEDKDINQKIYDQYLEAFNKGVYDYIKEDVDDQTGKMIPRKYFSGGVDWDEASSSVDVVSADNNVFDLIVQSTSSPIDVEVDLGMIGENNEIIKNRKQRPNSFRRGSATNDSFSASPIELEGKTSIINENSVFLGGQNQSGKVKTSMVEDGIITVKLDSKRDFKLHVWIEKDTLMMQSFISTLGFKGEKHYGEYSQIYSRENDSGIDFGQKIVVGGNKLKLKLNNVEKVSGFVYNTRRTDLRFSHFWFRVIKEDDQTILEVGDNKTKEGTLVQWDVPNWQALSVKLPGDGKSAAPIEGEISSASPIVVKDVFVKRDTSYDPDKRVNQDYGFVDKEKGMIFVSDGVGGRPAGDVASRIVGETVREYFKDIDVSKITDAKEIRFLIEDAILLARKNILDEIHKDPYKAGMTATIAFGFVWKDALGEEFFVGASIGDSRIHMYDTENEKLEQITVDDKLPGQSKISDSVARSIEVGFDHDLEVEVYEVQPKDKLEDNQFIFQKILPNAVFLALTDGFEKIPPSKIQEVVEIYPNIFDLGRALIIEAKLTGIKDDMTVAALDLRIKESASPIVEKSDQMSVLNARNGLPNTDNRSPIAKKGGIDLNSELLEMDMQIQGEGVQINLPVPQNSLQYMDIEGFIPIIINITPITNLPLFLGFQYPFPESENSQREELSWNQDFLVRNPEDFFQ